MRLPGVWLFAAHLIVLPKIVTSIQFLGWPNQVEWGQSYQISWHVEPTDIRWKVDLSKSDSADIPGANLATISEPGPIYDERNPFTATWSVDSSYDQQTYCLGVLNISTSTYSCAIWIPVKNVAGAPASASIVAASLVSGSPTQATQTASSVGSGMNPASSSPTSVGIGSATTHNGVASTATRVASPSSSPSPPEQVSGGAIAGIVIGALVVVGIIAGAGIWLLKRRKRRSVRGFNEKDMSSATSTTFTTPELGAGPFANRHELRGSTQYPQTPKSPDINSGASELDDTSTTRPRSELPTG